VLPVRPIAFYLDNKHTAPRDYCSAELLLTATWHPHEVNGEPPPTQQDAVRAVADHTRMTEDSMLMKALCQTRYPINNNEALSNSASEPCPQAACFADVVTRNASNTRTWRMPSHIVACCKQPTAMCMLVRLTSCFKLQQRLARICSAVQQCYDVAVLRLELSHTTVALQRHTRPSRYV
jgi:hypothetical protein